MIEDSMESTYSEFRIPNCYQCPVRQKSTSCRVKSATLSARRDA